MLGCELGASPGVTVDETLNTSLGVEEAVKLGLVLDCSDGSLLRLLGVNEGKALGNVLGGTDSKSLGKVLGMVFDASLGRY